MKFELYAAKAEVKLKDIPDNSIDSCVHDGPYGIRFMGKAWDSFDIKKNGSLRDSYPIGEKRKAKGRKTTGFGNSIEAGKYNTSVNANQQFQQFTTEISREIYRVLKPGAYFLSFCSPRTFHRLVCGIEDAGFEIRDTLMWIFGSGFPKSHNLDGDWEGWGSALKPAFEPICMARKPLEKGLTIAENVKKWGTGAINIDACRIEGEPWKWGTQTDIKGGNFNNSRPSNGDVFRKNVEGSEKGRWPANILHDGSDEVRALFPESTGQNADLVDAPSARAIFGNSLGKPRNFKKREDFDLSAARFFYVPKTSRADRNEGCESLPDVKGGMISNTSGQVLTRRDSEYKPEPVKNNHPTVKPTEAMQYLVRLVTPPKGTCLDHMCGSGSTGKACAIEDFDFIGIDEDPHNIEISRLRIQYILNHLDLFGKYQKR